jgi:hypothetical protein
MSDTEQQSKPTLRPAQVAASTLAAVTGAFLAARIGVYGTVIGVGVISLLSTIGSDFYLRSLDRTKQAAIARARHRNGSLMSFSGHESEDTTGVAFGAAKPVGDGRTVYEYRVATATEDTPAEPADTEEWTAETGALPADTEEIAAETGALPADTEEIAAETGALPADTEEIAAGNAASRPEDTATLPVPAALVAGGDSTTIEPPAVAESRRRLRWPVIAAGTLAAFALAMMVITGIEALTGSRLSGGEGSTIGTVFTPDQAEQPVDDEPVDPAPEDAPEPDPALTPTPPAPGEVPAPDQPPTEEPEPVDPPAEDDPAEEPDPSGNEPTPGDPGGEDDPGDGS